MEFIKILSKEETARAIWHAVDVEFVPEGHRLSLVVERHFTENPPDETIEVVNLEWKTPAPDETEGIEQAAMWAAIGAVKEEDD